MLGLLGSVRARGGAARREDSRGLTASQSRSLVRVVCYLLLPQLILSCLILAAAAKAFWFEGATGLSVRLHFAGDDRPRIDVGPGSSSYR
jgi:hypothetical protein